MRISHENSDMLAHGTYAEDVQEVVAVKLKSVGSKVKVVGKGH